VTGRAPLADAVVLGALWTAGGVLRDAATGWIDGFPPLPVAVSAPLGALVVPAWLAALWGTGAYAAPRWSWARLAYGVLVGLLVATLALFLAHVEVNRSLLVGFAVVSLPALGAARAIPLHRTPARGRVAVVGEGPVVAVVVARLRDRPEVGVVDVVDPQDLGALAVRLAPVDEVHAVGPLGPDALVAIAAACDDLGIPWSLDASFLGPRTARADLVDLDGFPVVSFRAASDASPDRRLKRAIDVLLAVGGLAVAAAPLLGVMFAIRAQDGGPALFRQVRVGRYGRPFVLYKLRTMVGGAEAQRAALEAANPIDGPAFKLPADPRVTPLGGWLRRWSVDELPQLVNVLRGDMSLVGPRPPLPDEVARYAPWQRRRLSVRPGLTGLWQVSGRADLPFEQWIALDLQYVDRWSLWLDLTVLARTVPAVLLGTGAR
jgi:exopolysaccharide biosynthesis polyprenyl glycosylphosphotransferase